MLHNFSWIVEGVLAGSAKPTADDWRELRGLGIRGVVCLTEGAPAQAEGVEFVHVPVRDFTAPSPDDIERAVEAIARFRSSGRPVLVHCGAGYGRTGTILACYLISLGEDAEAAIHRVRTARPGSVETAAQEHAAKAYGLSRSLRDGE
jgi:atypical dual specificity phosphatase